jgi:hypothetical protein
MADWTLSPGDTIKRVELHRHFGEAVGAASARQPSPQTSSSFRIGRPASSMDIWMIGSPMDTSTTLAKANAVISAWSVAIE